MTSSYIGLLLYVIRHNTVVKAARDKLFHANLHARWQGRVKLAIACPDNGQIPRVSDAGTVADGCLTMHNGIKVGVDSYYGKELADLIAMNRGVHEPQEEFAFQEVLKYVLPGSVMVELGAYWGFYSLWFTKAIPDGRTLLVEPETFNIRAGARNFEINGRQAELTQALIGDYSDVGAMPPVLCVDDLVASHKIAHVAILHADIQGHEKAMLLGSHQLLRNRNVDYVFISTHGLLLHLECLDILRSYDFVILASADKYESYSVDGLIVARRRELQGCPRIDISLR